jgi:hypothetical protein
MIYHRFTEKAAEQWRQIYKVPHHCFESWIAATNNFIIGSPTLGIPHQEWF